MPIRFPKEGNPNYPLPPDYESLGARAQSKARVNAMLLRERPEDSLWAWRFLREYYLMPAEYGFYLDRSTSSILHEKIAEARFRYRRSVIVAPRGFAKSKIATEELPLLELLRGPSCPVVIVKSKQRFAERAFLSIMRQLEINDRILEDFGDLRPSKGSAGTFNRSDIMLSNGGSCVAASIDSKFRGLRAGLLVADDVEHDPESESAVETLRERFRYTLTREWIPALRNGTIMCVGTMHRRDLMLYHMATTQEDPLFKGWYRRVYKAMEPDGTLLWPEEFTAQKLSEIREAIGDSAFSAEFLNEPLPEDTNRWLFDPMVHGYERGEPDEHYSSKPLQSSTEIRWYNKERISGTLTEQSGKASEVFGAMTRIITVDIGASTRADADCSVVAVMGLDSFNNLWVLDIWGGREPFPKVMENIFRMALKWTPRTIAVEATGPQLALASVVADKATAFRAAYGWSPGVMDLRYFSKVSKEDRIAGMSWRVTDGTLKMPFAEKYSKHWRDLFYQAENFTQDSVPGKRIVSSMLQHDDHLDAVSMAQYVFKGAGPKTKVREARNGPLEKILRGEVVDEYGIPWITRVGTQDSRKAESFLLGRNLGESSESRVQLEI